MQRIYASAPWRLRIRQSRVSRGDPITVWRNPLLIGISRERLARADNKGPLRDGSAGRKHRHSYGASVAGRAGEKNRSRLYSVRHANEKVRHCLESGSSVRPAQDPAIAAVARLSGIVGCWGVTRRHPLPRIARARRPVKLIG
jgi:hypothetical protein